jgi:hypothetical protein
MSKDCHHHDQGCNCKGQCECSCGCNYCKGNEHFQRQYQTKEEQIADLEAYSDVLKLELQAVEEHLADLRK